MALEEMSKADVSLHIEETPTNKEIVLVPFRRTVFLIVFPFLFGCSLGNNIDDDRNILFNTCFDANVYGVDEENMSIGEISVYDDGKGNPAIEINSPICGSQSFPFKGERKFLSHVSKSDLAEIGNQTDHVRSSKTYSFAGKFLFRREYIEVIEIYSLVDTTEYDDYNDCRNCGYEDFENYISIRKQVKKRALVALKSLQD